VNRQAHLPEERLFDCYLAQHNGETLDPPAADHLGECPACTARYSELTAFMDGLRDEGASAADAVFTPERLREQQLQIARRLEHVGRQARVISFPGQLVRRTMTTPGSHGALRWVAAAAAAGLFVGVAVGAGYRFGSHPHGAEQTLARTAPAVTRTVNPGQMSADYAFLSDLEVALERPHTRELIAFDALTPHVREVTAR
jgi:hypothetical protein